MPSKLWFWIPILHDLIENIQHVMTWLTLTLRQTIYRQLWRQTRPGTWQHLLVGHFLYAVRATAVDVWALALVTPWQQWARIVTEGNSAKLSCTMLWYPQVPVIETLRHWLGVTCETYRVVEHCKVGRESTWQAPCLNSLPFWPDASTCATSINIHNIIISA